MLQANATYIAFSIICVTVRNRNGALGDTGIGGHGHWGRGFWGTMGDLDLESYDQCVAI